MCLCYPRDSDMVNPYKDLEGRPIGKVSDKLESKVRSSLLHQVVIFVGDARSSWRFLSLPLQLMGRTKECALTLH